MAERSSPVVRALVNTSRTFPATTVRTPTTGEVPMSSAEAEAPASSAAILATGPLLAPSTVQNPTPPGAGPAARPSPRPAPHTCGRLIDRDAVDLLGRAGDEQRVGRDVRGTHHHG